MRANINIAIVGLGYWGPNLLRVLVDTDGSDVTWLCDVDAERLAALGRRYPAAGQTASVDEVLADPEVDAVVIATPVFTHFDLAQRALAAGKHVFVEKPLASSVAQADKLIELAELKQRVLVSGLTFLHSPPVKAVRALLERQELGEIFFVSSSRVNLGLHQRDVSVIWDLGPHDFSILLNWLDEMPHRVRAAGRAAIVPGIPDVVFVTLEFPSGVLANVELSWLAPGKLRRTVIVGSEKMVVYDDGAAEQVRIFDHGVIYEDPESFGQYHLSYRTGDVVAPALDNFEPLKAQMAYFTDLVREGRPSAADCEMARSVVAIAEAATESLRRDGAAIDMVPASRLGTSS